MYSKWQKQKQFSMFKNVQTILMQNSIDYIPSSILILLNIDKKKN